MILAQAMAESGALSAVMDAVGQVPYSVRDWLGSFTPAQRTAAVAVVLLALLLWTRRRLH